MSCYDCHRDPCDCTDSHQPKKVWKPSTTVARACYLIHKLLGSKGCDVSGDNNELCKLLEFHRDLCGGKYPLAALSMLVAAQLLESEAVESARGGIIKTLTVTVDKTKTSQQLMLIAKQWRETAERCVPQVRFAVAATGRGCLSVNTAYSTCGCFEKLTRKDAQTVTSCNFNCCDDCE